MAPFLIKPFIPNRDLIPDLIPFSVPSRTLILVLEFSGQCRGGNLVIPQVAYLFLPASLEAAVCMIETSAVAVSQNKATWPDAICSVLSLCLLAPLFFCLYRLSFFIQLHLIHESLDKTN